MRRQWVQILGIGSAQVVAWASSVYLPAILAQPLARELGVAPAWIFAAFSTALLLMAALGPPVGRHIDRRGGRRILCLGSLLLAAGLLALREAAGLPGVFAAWGLIGAGMALALYDAAFAALVREHGLAARLPITGITLLGGFASTLGWPLSNWLLAAGGWRLPCLFWALANLLVALPLNALLLRDRRAAAAPQRCAANQQPDAPNSPANGARNFLALAVFGAATSFVTSAMAAHLPGLLVAFGLPLAAAIAASAWVGPAQVIARLGEFLAARRFQTDALTSARLASLLHPLGGVLMLLLASPPVAVLLALLHGAGNGIITIAKGTLPLQLFGVAGYGHLQGRLAVAQRISQAAAPFAFALVLDAQGAYRALGLTVSVGLLGVLALYFIRGGRASVP